MLFFYAKHVFLCCFFNANNDAFLTCQLQVGDRIEAIGIMNIKNGKFSMGQSAVCFMRGGLVFWCVIKRDKQRFLRRTDNPVLARFRVVAQEPQPLLSMSLGTTRKQKTFLVAICINNDECLIKNDEFCIKNDELCIENDEFNTNVQEPGQEVEALKISQVRRNERFFAIKNDEFW